MAISFGFNPFTGNFDEISKISIGSPANGLSVTSDQVLSLALSSTSTTGALSNTDWNTFNGKQPAGNYITALTGDGAASGPGSAALTLATVNGNVGSFGSASNTLTITANGKGLITAISAAAIQIAESQVTNLTTDLAGKLSTSLTSAHLFIGNAGVATDTAMSGDITINSTGVTAIGANKVADTMIRQSAGLSVIGRSASTTGNVADITGTADQVLRVAGAGASVGFGSIDLSKSAAVGASILTVPNGGTGLAALTAHKIPVGNGTSAANLIDPSTSGFVLTSNGASADPTFQTAPALISSATDFKNVGLAVSVSGNALTIALKQADGSTDPSTGAAACQIGFKGNAVTDGSYSVATATAATSIVVPSGATLGHVSNVNQNIFVYAINNGGTIELAVITIPYFDLFGGGRAGTTTIGAGSTSATSFYSSTGRATISYRLIARIGSNQPTAGTWTVQPAVWLIPYTPPRVPYASTTIYTGNGFGSTNTKIRKFSAEVTTDPFSIMTVVSNSATLGASITFNFDCIATVSYTDTTGSGGDCLIGVSLNSNQLTTSIQTITATDRLCSMDSTRSNVAVTWSFRAGDVIRPHTSGNMNATTDYVMMRVVVNSVY